MAIDLTRLNTNFDLLSTNESLADVLGKICRPHNDYFVVLQEGVHAGDAKVVDRYELLSRLTAMAGLADDEELRQLWTTIENRPSPRRRELPNHARLWKGALAEVEARVSQTLYLNQSEIGRIVQETIDATPARPMLKINSVAPTLPRNLVVVAKAGSPLGIVEPRGSSRRAKRNLSNATHSIKTSGSAEGAAGEAFHAHPKLAVDRALEAGKEFRILVGFSDTADAEADFSTPINIENPQVGETMDVLISATGADLVESWKVELPLDMSAQGSISATVRAAASEVKLSASYVFRERLVGTISKTIVVDATEAVGRRTKRVALPTWLPALADANAIVAVDVILIVHRQDPSSVEWKAFVPKSGKVWGPLSVSLPDATVFAKQLSEVATKGRGQADNGRLDVIDVGQTVAALVPSAILDEVLTPHLAEGRTPSILLFTDEPFVPWELARLSPAQAARAKAAFLGEVACIGRWWLRANSSGPASSTTIHHISAVAASRYNDKVHDTLKHAISERRLLVDKYTAERVEARAKPIELWLAQSPQPGHLAHIALHGYSDPASQEEALILGDGSTLTPIRLSGEWNMGETPRFSMVFLNACQVGTAGTRLGQVGGFPGVLIRNGIGAFIAPLWEVDDAAASEVAETFYEQALSKRTDVGEALRGIRAGLDKSITPLAYLYYGHPALHLTLADAIA